MDNAEQNQAENTVKNGTAPNTSASSPVNSPAESASAEAATPGMEAVQVDAVQIDSARLDSSRAVYSTDLNPDDDYEEVVEEYATTDAPDGTHREERRITRTARATRKLAPRRQAPRVTLIVPPRLLTRANLKRTPRPSARSPAPSRTRRVAPRAPACSARSASTAARRTWPRGKTALPRPCSWRPCCTCLRSPRPS